MESHKKIILVLSFIFLFTQAIFSQNEFTLGEKKIKVPGVEICNYTVNENSHLNKLFLEIKNGILLYTMVEYKEGVAFHIEMTECKIEDLDLSSCSLGASDQKSTYTPGAIYIIYLYTKHDQLNISTTIYDLNNSTASIQKSAISRLHFRDYTIAKGYFDNNFK